MSQREVVTMIKLGGKSRLMHRMRRFGCGLLVVSLLISVMPATSTVAAIASCDLTSSPHTVAPGSTTDFGFQLTNTDGANTVQWIQVTTPTTQLVLNSASSSGWGTTVGVEKVTYAGGSLAAGATAGLSINATADLNEAPSNDWYAQVSDDPSGANAIYCNNNGNTWTTITNPPPPSIDNLHLANLDTTAVTVAWNTDVPATSQLDYGTDAGYGTTVAVSGLPAMSHSTTLTGLGPNTIYHYRVTVTNAQHTSTQSGDNTFITPIANSNSKGSRGVSPGLVVGPIVPVTPGDTVAPQISFTSAVAGVFRQPPRISGVASDNGVVAKVEYSFDGGKNWLPVDKLVTAGQAKVSFNFTAPPLDDGNYSVIARATDGGGNQSDTAPQTVVIDRLPPVVGGTVLSSGTQILSPNSDGTLTIAAESSVTFTANAAGGPTQITLVAWPTDTTQSPESFRLRRSADTGLWSGNLALGRPGHYSLIAKAKDGAGSTTERTVGQLLVASPGHIIDARTKLPVTATVTLHYRDPCTNRWTLWDGSAYGQANPVVTAADGSFGLRAQAGMYYAQVSAPGYQTVVTRSFTVDRSQVISATISLQREPGFKLGPWTLRLPWFSFSQTPIDVSTNRSAATSRALPQLPNISLPLVAGGQLKMVDLLGHPTILTIVSTWAQPARDQLAILDQLPHLDANVVAVGSGQSLAKLATYEQISGYQVRLVADVDSQFMASLGASTLPTTYFIDRHGVVKKVMVGVLSKQELFNNVTTN